MPRQTPWKRGAPIPERSIIPEYKGDTKGIPPYTDVLLKGCDENILGSQDKSIKSLYAQFGQTTERTDIKKIGTTGRGLKGRLYMRVPQLWKISQPEEKCYGIWKPMEDYCRVCRKKISRPETRAETLWSMFPTLNDSCNECEKDQTTLGGYGFEERRK